MPEIRTDAVQNYSVVIAPKRNQRPRELSVEESLSNTCPFCPGNEDKTPPEVFRINNTLNQWTTRTVPNKYPAFSQTYDKKFNAIQEVIIETQKHLLGWGQFSKHELLDVLKTYQNRLKEISKFKHIKNIVIFKNHGVFAGASLSHSHSQVVGLGFVPEQIKQRAKNLKQHFTTKKRCYLCESYNKQNIVLENKEFSVSIPKTARIAYESLILPKKHNAYFEKITVSEQESLAEILLETIQRINKQLKDPPYNLILNNGSYAENEQDYFHWHIQIIPRTSQVAGFEIATGMFINDMDPKQAAQNLNNAI